MKQSCNYKGWRLFPNIIYTEPNSFAYVDIASGESFLRLSSNNIRDWDKVQETLGNRK